MDIIRQPEPLIVEELLLSVDGVNYWTAIEYEFDGSPAVLRMIKEDDGSTLLSKELFNKVEIYLERELETS